MKWFVVLILMIGTFLLLRMLYLKDKTILIALFTIFIVGICFFGIFVLFKYLSQNWRYN